MYVRFICDYVHRESARRAGIFQAAAWVEEWRLPTYDDDHLWDLRMWFAENLARPTRFTNSKPPYYRRSSRALSWFRDSAKEHIANAREMASILERNGLPIDILMTRKPGYIVYQDEFQVAAEPFADTGA